MLFLGLACGGIHAQAGQTTPPQRKPHKPSSRTPAPLAPKAFEPGQIAALLGKSLVLIETRTKSGKPVAQGSGFFLNKETIVTNLHVFQWAYSATAKVVQNGERLYIHNIQIVDRQHDLCTFTVDYDGTPVKVASQLPSVGDRVYALGNPMGLEATFSAGMVSAIRGNQIQMDAPISRGSSGGPVANDRGEVIGVSSATVEGGQNLNFVIPLTNLAGDPDNLPVNQAGRLALTDLDYEHLSGPVKEVQSQWFNVDHGQLRSLGNQSANRYDQNGNLIGKCTRKKFGPTECTMYVRDSDTLITQSERFIGANHDAPRSYEHEEALAFEIDSHIVGLVGRVDENETEVHDEFGRVIEHRYRGIPTRRITYGEPGLPEQQFTVDLAGQIVQTFRFTYEFDSRGNWTKQTGMASEGNGWHTSMVQTREITYW